MDENYDNNFEFGWANQTPGSAGSPDSAAASAASVFPEEPAEAEQAELPEEPKPFEAQAQSPAPPPAPEEQPAQAWQNPFGPPLPQSPPPPPPQAPPSPPVWQGGYAQQSWQPVPPVPPVPPQPQPWQGGYTQAWGPAQTAVQPPPPKRKKTGAVIFALFLVLLLCAGAAVGVQIYRASSNSERPSASSANDPTESTLDNAQMTLVTPPAGLGAGTEGVLAAPDVHDKLIRSNVLVQVYGSRDSVAGEGSGILLMEDDTGTYTYVVTCAHVLEDQSKVSVELENGESYDAIVVAADTRTDIGLIKIMKTGLVCAEFGDSAALRVGETVYALGNPGGSEFPGSFTAGIVSAIDRPIQSGYKQLLIQHTAPISPGNSGGMLINAAGQVVGINSLKIVDYQYEGMGFAIPSKVVKTVVDDLIKYGRVPNRPKLGIRYLAASQSQLGYYVIRMQNLPSGSLIIAEIDEDSGFRDLDVQPNDIITHVNGKPLTKSDVLLNVIDDSAVGDTLKLTIVRVSRNYDVNKFDISVKLVEDKGSTEESTTQPPGLDFFNQYGW